MNSRTTPAHEAHPLALLLGRHRQRDVQGRCALIGVVGIHDQRLRQFARRPGELGQDQHALFVVARRDELLRHEIHPSCRLVTMQMSAARMYS
jgi:hypothetical protein